MKKNEVVVTIFGNDYRVVAEDLDVERIKTIAGIVDKKMRDIHREFPLPSTTKIAVLACLNLVDEYLQNKDQLERRLKDLESRITALILKTDEVVS